MSYWNQLDVGGLIVYADFFLAINGEVLATGFLEKSKIKVKGAGARFGSDAVRYWCERYGTKNDEGWAVSYCHQSIGKGRDGYWYGMAISQAVGKRFLVTTEKLFLRDLENFLMKNFRLPLLHEWIKPIAEELSAERHIFRYPRFIARSASDNRKVVLQGEEVSLADLQVYHVGGITNENFSTVVSDLLKGGQIKITDQVMDPLQFKDFDSYIKTYGKSLVENLEKEIEPLSPLVSKVDSLALKTKRLYPQQASCVEGMKSLRRAGIRYGIMNEGMGVGKTIQAGSVLESWAVDEWLKKHPGKTVKDAYQTDAEINYRNIVICPGHLVEKWAEELRTEVPHAKVEILNDLSQLVKIREEGRVPKGRQFYIIGKDFAKLGTQEAPIPTQVKTAFPSASICKDCFTEDHTVRYMRGMGRNATCPECGGHRATPHKFTGWHKETGMVCPNCGELLLQYKGSGINWQNPGKGEDGEVTRLSLSPSDFAHRTSGNSVCYHCGTPLWGANAKPLDNGNHDQCGQHSKTWSKVSFFKNQKKKNRETAFVLKGHEWELYGNRGIDQQEMDVKKLAADYGPRKVAPAHYIKKYLKGYFDFCVLDEVHKFEGAGTAQATAAHALIQASNFSLGLTGTISNGSASSFYYLLYMLDPKRMREKGFSWSSFDMMRFCKQYGCVETLYEGDARGDDEYNSNSRGRQLRQPKVKPGISPMLFVDFLLDRCVFLDITDLSRFLPPLKESVEIVKLPDDIYLSCNRTIGQLKEAAHSGEGRTVLSEMLNFGLSYPDKPYGRHPIMSAIHMDEIVANVDNFPEYEEKLLPKEERLVELVNSELSEDRNCFVYASYTGVAETNVTGRLQSILEKHCNLKGHVKILDATVVPARDRELWIKKAAKDGVRVIITNPKCVETGLDFCFNYEGRFYNYPTLFFYQMGYEMSVIWQASRRHYRLNQTAECRTYYLAYENTLQTAALEIMAEKQVATSAIQGKFSSEGLASMAKGVDTRTQLAAAMSKNDMGDRKSLENMFDVMNQTDASSDDKYGDYVPPMTYSELLGIDEKATEGFEDDFGLMFTEVAKVLTTENRQIAREVNHAKPTEISMALFDSFDRLFGDTGINFTVLVEDISAMSRSAKKKSCEGQLSIASFFD